MRFMLFMLPNIEDADYADYGAAPPADAVEKMSKYNAELQKAGVLLALDGLHSQSDGHRVAFRGGKPIVIDGPFTEAKEAIGGYWIIDVKSKEEALEWAKRVPTVDGDFTIEVRRIQDIEEMPADVQEAAKF